MVPLEAIVGVVLLFVKEKRLATTVENDVLSELIADDNILITADDEVAAASR